jgi:uncharacterized protein (TIGR03067 family)
MGRLTANLHIAKNPAYSWDEFSAVFALSFRLPLPPPPKRPMHADRPLLKFASRAVCLAAVAAEFFCGMAGAASSEPIVELVRQLGHEEFAARERASRRLLELGEESLPALRRAAASDSDPEIRWRAEQIVQSTLTNIRAAAMKRALADLQGSWTLVYSEAGGKQTGGEVKSYVFSFQGEKWAIHAGGRLSQGGTVTRIEVQEKLNAIDLAITEGANLGVTAISIYAVEGDTLKYINSAEPRATEFATKPGDGRYYSIFRRAKP